MLFDPHSWGWAWRPQEQGGLWTSNWLPLHPWLLDVHGPGQRLSQPVFLHLSKVRASVCLSVMLSSCLWAALILLIPGGASDKEPACFTWTFHFHALEKEMATHSSVLAWRIPGTGEPGGLPSMGSRRVGHD